MLHPPYSAEPTLSTYVVGIAKPENREATTKFQNLNLIPLAQPLAAEQWKQQLLFWTLSFPRNTGQLVVKTVCSGVRPRLESQFRH